MYEVLWAGEKEDSDGSTLFVLIVQLHNGLKRFAAVRVLRPLDNQQLTAFLATADKLLAREA